MYPSKIGQCACIRRRLVGRGRLRDPAQADFPLEIRLHIGLEDSTLVGYGEGTKVGRRLSNSQGKTGAARK
jgi:hypothetical protein